MRHHRGGCGGLPTPPDLCVMPFSRPQANAGAMEFTIIRPGGLKSEPATGAGVLTEDKQVCGAVHREDVARLVVKALLSPKATNKVMNGSRCADGCQYRIAGSKCQDGAQGIIWQAQTSSPMGSSPHHLCNLVMLTIWPSDRVQCFSNLHLWCCRYYMFHASPKPSLSEPLVLLLQCPTSSNALPAGVVSGRSISADGRATV